MPEVVCIGSANADIIARVERFPKPDEEVGIRELNIDGGGSASNVAVGLSRLGHASGFVGILGTDYFADFLVKEFEKDRVDYSRATRLEGTGGIVIVTVNPKGERTMLLSQGVVTNLSKEHVPEDYIRKARFLHMTSIIGSDNITEAFEHASSVAKEAGVRVVLDPGTVFAEQLDRIKCILKNCYAILPSEMEAEMLTGLKDEEAGKKLLDYGPEAVVITQGENGCLLVTKNLTKHFPAVRVRARDTTGAGDSFSAGFIAALLEEKSIEEACEFANKVAAVSITKGGARTTPTRDELL